MSIREKELVEKQSLNKSVVERSTLSPCGVIWDEDSCGVQLWDVAKAAIKSGSY